MDLPFIIAAQIPLLRTGLESLLSKAQLSIWGWVSWGPMAMARTEINLDFASFPLVFLLSSRCIKIVSLVLALLIAAPAESWPRPRPDFCIVFFLFFPKIVLINVSGCVFPLSILFNEPFLEIISFYNISDFRLKKFLNYYFLSLKTTTKFYSAFCFHWPILAWPNGVLILV